MLESTLKYAESMGYKLTTVNNCVYGIDTYLVKDHHRIFCSKAATFERYSIPDEEILDQLTEEEYQWHKTAEELLNNYSDDLYSKTMGALQDGCE
nr:MAG TPA: hypothetical protein [Bacteriophage sp.]